MVVGGLLDRLGEGLASIGGPWCWGIKLRGPNHPRDPAPLGPPLQQGQGDRLVHYQFILETGLRTETNNW